MKFKCKLNVDSDIYFLDSTPVYFDENNRKDIWFNINVYKRKDKFYGKLDIEDISFLHLVDSFRCVYLKPIYEVDALLGFIINFTDNPSVKEKLYKIKPVL